MSFLGGGDDDHQPAQRRSAAERHPHIMWPKDICEPRDQRAEDFTRIVRFSRLIR